ncbi:MAG: peptidoglycan DD-metalloendopeptidase family protein [bacterium]|nr:peptidoglycan DD-metalloendopeptidase family protein [bacterium]
MAEFKAKIPILREFKPFFLIRAYPVFVGVAAIILCLAFFNLTAGEKGAFILKANLSGLGGPEFSEDKVSFIARSVNSVADAVGPEDNPEEDDGDFDFLGYWMVGEDAIYGYLSPLTILASINFRDGLMTYEVKEGDSPAKIAAAFGITTNTLLWANDLKSGDYIKSGQKFIILPVSGVKHDVKSGDTVGSLAKKYGAQEKDIIAFNNLPENGALKIGQVLIIPGGKIISSTRQAAAPPYYSPLPNLTGYFIYPAAGWNWGKLHNYNAVDIANQCGTPIYAAAAGLVSEAVSTGTCRSCNQGYGLYILIEHPNGTKTRYAHLDRLLVKQGEYVDQKQIIAYMGNTGLVYGTTGCHIHFEVHGARNPLVK